jgi:ABC-type bacteriocin/lantibiotic exporter with double-glycine peptidase domain
MILIIGYIFSILLGNIDNHPPTDMLFDNIKHELIERLRADVKVVMTNNDQNKSVERISNEVKSSLMYTGAVQTVSAFSVGSLIAAHMLDVTGTPLTPTHPHIP